MYKYNQIHKLAIDTNKQTNNNYIELFNLIPPTKLNYLNIVNIVNLELTSNITLICLNI